MAASRRFIVRQGDEATPVEVLADGRVRSAKQADVFTVTLIVDWRLCRHRRRARMARGRRGPA